MRQNLAAALVAALLLTACGGGAANSSLPLAKPPSGGGTVPSKHRKVKATIRITIPKKHKHHRVRVHGHYVSSATQSIAIAVTPAGGAATNYNANLTSANPNCTASLVSPLICTVIISLAPASYTATFATYDGPLSGEGGVSDPPTGNVLSSNQSASFSVVAGQANGINVSLDGVAAGVTLVPAANSSFFGNTASGYSISKCGTATANGESVSVFGTDADGNLIVGPGAPTTTLASGDTTLIAVATPAPSAPNLYTISHPISNTAQNPATLTATATTADDAGGGTQTVHALVQTLGGTQLCGFITEYGLGGAFTSPAGITTGPDGNLWFTESGNARIGKITTDGSITTYSATEGYPWNIITGPDGNLWFSDFQLGIGTSTTAGVVTYANTGLGYQQRVQGIAPDPTMGVWITEQSGNSVDRWDGSTLTPYPVGDPYYGPVGIVYGPDGNFWVTLGSGQIERITTAGVATVFAGPSGAPQAITVGPDNKLWFGERGIVNAIGRMTTTGTVTNEYALPFGTNPNAITLGPDNNVWFAEQGSNQIGNVTTNGVITQYSLQGGASPQGITTGPDGNIWFTECGTGIIGRLQ